MTSQSYNTLDIFIERDRVGKTFVWLIYNRLYSIQLHVDISQRRVQHLYSVDNLDMGAIMP